jgi:hypothetical protein
MTFGLTTGQLRDPAEEWAHGDYGDLLELGTITSGSAQANAITEAAQ